MSMHDDGRPLVNQSAAIASQTMLPRQGRWMIRDWAAIWDCSVETVRKDIKKHCVKTIQCGGTIVIDAAWWWEGLERGERT